MQAGFVQRQGAVYVKLFVGLGNPGAKYAGNRHNIGFMAVERIAADHGFGPWKKAHQGLVSEGRLGDEKVVLLKPETFMNLSGQSVRSAVDFWKLTPDDIVVFHDELDLAPGKMPRSSRAAAMPGTTACGRSTAIWARPMAGCGWASAIPATRTRWRIMCCMTSPRPIRTGWMTCCAAFPMAPRRWRRAMARGS